MVDLVVVDVFEGVADHTDAHVDQVGRGHLEDLLRELLPVLVDFLPEKNVHITCRRPGLA